MKKILSILTLFSCIFYYSQRASAQTVKYLYKHSTQKNNKPDTILIDYIRSGVFRVKYKDGKWFTKTENDTTCIMELPGTVVVINKKPFIGKSLYHNEIGIEYTYPMDIGELLGEYCITFLGTENGMKKYTEKTKILNTDNSVLYQGQVTTIFSSGEYIYYQYGNDSEGYYSITLCK